MSFLTFTYLIFVVSFLAVGADRRIKGGHVSATGKRYAVYLLRAPSSPQPYDEWLCGGAIVTKWYIITSAACVEDVQHMYAISGRKKYVPTVNQDECVNSVKKKIVYTCVPKAYELDYEKIEKWAYIDIALAKVESEFKLEDSSAYSKCDYSPQTILVNYETRHQETGQDTLVMGWGHQEKWRRPEDTNNYNTPDMHCASAAIQNKKDCKEYFSQIQSLQTIIDKYMICTLEKGNIDEKGDLILKSPPIADGCTPQMDRLSFGDIVCEEDETILLDDTRKKLYGDKMLSRILRRQQEKTRRQGICQNDHGGPLITWVGGHEYLIGVASVFRVTNDSMCTGPYLYTSTQCNGAFINCILTMDDESGKKNDETRKRLKCDQPPSVRGFDMVTTTISWEHHPAGLADNEKLMMRPLAPLYK